MTLVFLCLTYFTQYDNLQVHCKSTILQYIKKKSQHGNKHRGMFCGGSRCLWRWCGWKSGLAYLSWNDIVKRLESYDKESNIVGHRSQSTRRGQEGNVKEWLWLNSDCVTSKEGSRDSMPTDGFSSVWTLYCQISQFSRRSLRSHFLCESSWYLNAGN